MSRKNTPTTMEKERDEAQDSVEQWRQLLRKTLLIKKFPVWDLSRPDAEGREGDQ